MLTKIVDKFYLDISQILYVDSIGDDDEKLKVTFNTGISIQVNNTLAIEALTNELDAFSEPYVTQDYMSMRGL